MTPRLIVVVADDGSRSSKRQPFWMPACCAGTAPTRVAPVMAWISAAVRTEHASVTTPTAGPGVDPAPPAPDVAPPPPGGWLAEPPGGSVAPGAVALVAPGAFAPDVAAEPPLQPATRSVAASPSSGTRWR